ncbi:MAG: GNAT family N-acetyltransferase [Promethearchaeota archaeon]
MIKQIPQKQLINFWPYFKEHQLLNLLAQNLAWSKVEGYLDDFENPDVIMFMCQQWAYFLAGNNRSVNLTEFLAKIPEKTFIYVPSQKWEASLKSQWTYTGYFTRTALSAQNLSLQKIQHLLTPLPEGFQLKKLDIEVAHQILTQNFADHWVNVINYLGGPEKFVEEGVGYCIQLKEDNKIVSFVMGFTSSIPLTHSVELDILTHPDYRGRDFATIVSAKLIEYLLKEKIEPHWDAANPRSTKLAIKLGYTDPSPYKCYYWRRSPWTISDLKENFEPQFNKGLENLHLLKSKISTFKQKKKGVEGSFSFLSRLTKIEETFNQIFSDLNRFLDSRIVNEPDVPQFKKFCKKLRQQLDAIEKLKNEIGNPD